MAKSPKRSIPQGEMEEKNKELFNLFMRQDERGDEYKKKAGKLLRYFEDKPFSHIKLDNVVKFRKELEDAGYTRIDQYIYSIIAFRDFVKSYDSDTFNEKFLEGLEKIIKKSEDGETPGEVLDPTQIYFIREYNEKYGDTYDQYIFELFFQLDIQENELEFCLPEKNDPVKQCFVTSQGKEIPYNAKIKSLLGEIQDSEELRRRFKNVKYHYRKKITDYFRQKEVYKKGRKINLTHLKKSHDAYILICPNCSQKVENIAENWVLVRTEFDETYRLVCKECKGESQ